MNKGCCTCIWRTVFSVLGVPAIRPRRKFTPSSRHRVEFLKLTLPLSRNDGLIATQRTGELMASESCMSKSHGAARRLHKQGAVGK